MPVVGCLAEVGTVIGEPGSSQLPADSLRVSAVVAIPHGWLPTASLRLVEFLVVDHLVVLHLGLEVDRAQPQDPNE